MGLLEQRLKARTSTIVAGGRVFTLRRPTDEEALNLSRDGSDMLAVVRQFIVDWEVQEIDLIPGGTTQKVPFDRALFSDWIADQPPLWVPLGEAILVAYQAHAEKRDGAVKN